jgi:hypothetical protein
LLLVGQLLTMRKVWVNISYNSPRSLNFSRPYRDKNTFSFHILFKSPPIIILPSDGTTPETMTAPCNRNDRLSIHAFFPMTPAVCLAQARAAMAVMRSALFWVVTQRVVVNPHRCFGTTYLTYLQGSWNIKSSADLIYIAKEAWNQWLWCSPLQQEAPRLGLRIWRHKSWATIGICREKGCT